MAFVTSVPRILYYRIESGFWSSIYGRLDLTSKRNNNIEIEIVKNFEMKIVSVKQKTIIVKKDVAYMNNSTEKEFKEAFNKATKKINSIERKIFEKEKEK
jgi:hypothetical protein